MPGGFGGFLPNPARISSMDAPFNNAKDSSAAAALIRKKHDEYYKSGRLYQFGYYATRLLAGLSAALIPFVVVSSPNIATGLSLVVVVATVVDTVFDPKSKWALYSRASDLLAIAELKARGEYGQYKDALKIILATEQQQLEDLKGLEDILKVVQQTEGTSDPPAK